jgi:stage II sporulation protein AA (anti-sigma F factor antagonist)
MEFESSAQGDTVQVRLSGRMTYKDHESFKQLRGLLDGEVRELEVDVDPVSFMDSAGIGMLLVLRDEAGRKGAAFRLKGGTGQVRRLLAAVDIGKVMEWRN